jgi:glutamate formiminotransferase
MLDTADVAVARSVAAAIRESAPGGLPAVRAMGVFLESRGIAQVSMNLLDYRVTPPLAVAERVERELRIRGAAAREWELVGCAPADAFAGWEAAGRHAFAPRVILDPGLFTLGA